MSDTAAPEPDCVQGAPHPRQTRLLYGQQDAEKEFLDAFVTGRLHHGWILTGPIGVGKATLAWRIARFLRATQEPESGGGLFAPPPPPTSLDIPEDHPVVARTRALTETGLYLVRRGGKGDREEKRRENFLLGEFSEVIRIEEVRGLANFLHMSNTEGGRRVVIVDCADDMNAQAANGLLKMLEEPPARTTLLLISHQPSRLLSTIRSRCRALRLKPLSVENMHSALQQTGLDVVETPALAELSAGSVGEAIRLVRLGGLEMYERLVAMFATLPVLDRQRALKLAELAAQRGGGERFELLLTLIDVFVTRAARTGATGRPPTVEAASGEIDLLARLAPDARAARTWAVAAQEITDRSRHGKAVNLDPAALVLDTVFKIKKTATV